MKANNANFTFQHNVNAALFDRRKERDKNKRRLFVFQ